MNIALPCTLNVASGGLGYEVDGSGENGFMLDLEMPDAQN
jgi:hypothetical protein